MKRNFLEPDFISILICLGSIDRKYIEDGDYVIVDPNDRNIKTSDYVLSIIDDVANIKKIVIDRNNSQVFLFSESTYQYAVIFIEESEAPKYVINGKVIPGN